MKKVIFTAFALALLGLSASAQDLKRDDKGNFIAVKPIEAAHDSITGLTYTNPQGEVETVYKGKKGAFYVARWSKPSDRNNYQSRYYRKYLKAD